MKRGQNLNRLKVPFCSVAKSEMDKVVLILSMITKMRMGMLIKQT